MLLQEQIPYQILIQRKQHLAFFSERLQDLMKPIHWLILRWLWSLGIITMTLSTFICWFCRACSTILRCSRTLLTLRIRKFIGKAHRIFKRFHWSRNFSDDSWTFGYELLHVLLLLLESLAFCTYLRDRRKRWVEGLRAWGVVVHHSTPDVKGSTTKDWTCH